MWGGGGSPPLPAKTTAPTEDDPATKANADKAIADERARAKKRLGFGATRHTNPLARNTRPISLIGGGEV